MEWFMTTTCSSILLVFFARVLIFLAHTTNCGWFGIRTFWILDLRTLKHSGDHHFSPVFNLKRARNWALIPQEILQPPTHIYSQRSLQQKTPLVDDSAQAIGGASTRLAARSTSLHGPPRLLETEVPMEGVWALRSYILVYIYMVILLYIYIQIYIYIYIGIQHQVKLSR